MDLEIGLGCLLENVRLEAEGVIFHATLFSCLLFAKHLMQFSNILDIMMFAMFGKFCKIVNADFWQLCVS